MLFLINTGSEALAISDSGIRSKADRTLGYYNRQASYDDWEGLGLRWMGSEITSRLAASSAASASDYARLLLGQMAAGEPAVTINATIATLQGMQKPTGDFNSAGASSLNQTIWPLISLNCAAVNGFTVNFDEEAAAAYIAGEQTGSGAFDESGWGADVDSTAHALIALAPYKDDYPQAIEKALTYLKSQQDVSGGFQSWGSVSPDSTAAVIEALVALGYDPQVPPGSGWQGNIVEALLGYQLKTGAFYAPWAVGTPNSITTRSALLALGDLVQEKSKYLNIMPSASSLALTVTTNGDLHLDGDASINVKIDNVSSDTISFLLIAALYDTSNELMQVYSSIGETVAGDTAINVEYGLSLPSSGDYEVRIFAWDDWTNRTPLTSTTYIPID